MLYLRHDLRIKFHRKTVSAHNRKDIHPRIIDMPENLHHFSFRILSLFPVLCDFNNDFMTVYSSFRTLQRNKNIRTKLWIIRHCKAKIFIQLIRAHHLLHAPFKHMQHLSLPAASGHCR